MERINLGDYITAPAQGIVATTAVGDLEKFELAAFVAQWKGLQREALVTLGEDRRITPPRSSTLQRSSETT
ncbi:hypothetical protein ACFYYB_27175 [Streptomyces sp. NPDC002886]|uniref:hypothetical protein n=1 Tax=Streptomyces sp. NPDC002886 TaxID=3364667 RepID=UPI0036C89260